MHALEVINARNAAADRNVVTNELRNRTVLELRPDLRDVAIATLLAWASPFTIIAGPNDVWRVVVKKEIEERLLNVLAEVV